MTEPLKPENLDDPAWRDKAQRYSRTKEWLVLVSMAWSLAANTLALVTGASASLRRWSRARAPQRLGPVAPYTTVGLLAAFLSSMPLSYFSGFVIEHRYGLSNQTRRAWLVDQLKGLLVSLALAVPLAQGAFWIIRRYPRRWWAVLAGLTVPFSVLLTNLAPVLILPLFNKFEPIRDRALADRIKKLAAGEGVQVSDVLQMDLSKQTKKVNAFFTGMGNTRRIVVGDTLLNDFSADEVEVVLAHELGHQVHRDLWKLIGLQVPVALATFYAAHRFSGPAISRFGKRLGLDPKEGAADVAALPLLTLLGGGAGMLLGPAVNATVRRLVEHPADRYALDLTGKREAFIGAMEKLAVLNLANPRPAKLIKWLLYDHPPIQERIDFARRYKVRTEG